METLWSEKGYFGLLVNDHILVYYPIISYQSIKVYKVETMYMGIFLWNNGVSGNAILLSYVVFIARDKILWLGSYGVDI